MSVPVTEFIQITINLASPSGPQFGFGSLMGVFTHDVTLARESGPYTTIQAVVADGFTSTAAPEIYAWASTWFSQPRRCREILIGRRVPEEGGPAAKVWRVDVTGPTFVDETLDFNDAGTADWQVFPTGDAAGDYAAFGALEPFEKITLDSTGGTAGTDGVVVWEYWNGAAWSALANVVDGTSDFTAAVSAGQEVTWDLPLDWEPLVLNGADPFYYVRARITTPFTIDPVYDSGTIGGDASWTATMDAIEQSLGRPWYITNIESRDPTDIAEVSTWTEARKKIYIAQTSQNGVPNGTVGNIAEVLEGLARDRTSLVWYNDDAVYADGGVASVGGGLNLDAIGGVGIWGFQKIASVPAISISGPKWDNIDDQNANSVIESGGRTFFSRGKMSSGQRIDVITTSDWLEQRLQEALSDLWVQTPTKIPYTDGGINTIVATCQAIFDNGVSFGHFAQNPAPVVSAPVLSEIPAADKQARRLALSASATLAGAIEEVIPFIIDLQF